MTCAKVKQLVAIQQWKTWQRSTCPESLQVKAKVAHTVFMGGSWQELGNAHRLLKLAVIVQARFLDGIDERGNSIPSDRRMLKRFVSCLWNCYL